jgi:hypothetical protein
VLVKCEESAEVRRLEQQAASMIETVEKIKHQSEGYVVRKSSTHIPAHYINVKRR